ncbi:GerMN domain-containing protein [Calidifontibacillus erzurumensis]|uniref:GerMN domain-containing protein n=1 Tax=Calidifontibacillus erzurumensis TaxID=2741433 RepID=A0A8J8GEQ2_9BACI|nr:GerMN domain-containing protein [Calidifontibacillus erzurumensis]NSL50491.1 GerMN domain-containing protein [Calidifontibacillus erzurumensis]
MHKQTFDEEQLEKLLQNMPKVKDTQDPEQLFTIISSRIEEKEQKPLLKEEKSTWKKKSWLLPTLASIAAIVIVAIVSPSFLYEQKKNEKQVAFDSQKENAALNEQNEQTERENFTMMAREMPSTVIDSSISHVITSKGDAEEILTVAIPDRNVQFVVPVSFVVPNNETETKLDRMETIQEHLYEDAWGLSNYILENVQYSEDKSSQALIVNVPANHTFGQGSAMEVIFLATVKEMAKQMGYQSVIFETEGKPGILLGNYGEITTLDLQKEEAKGVYYIFQPEGYLQKFLVPFPKEVSFSKALEMMKMPNEMDKRQLKPAIPEEIKIKSAKIDPKKNVAIVDFAEGTIVPNDENGLLMIEAILMTAKEFGVSAVEFNNVGVDIIGQYNLQNSIPVPLAVNPMPY